jgi:dienelactone hydrolase
MSADVNWVIKHHLGIIGLGEGSGPAVVYAADHPEVRAVSMISTVLPEDGAVASVLGRLAVPVLGLSGAIDAPASGVDDERLLNGSFVTYSGVTGPFLDDGSNAYDSAASADACRRLVDFLSRTLPPPEVGRLG